jgi:hypothetical protein
MKKGDLIVLSKKGRDLKLNKNFIDGFGIVMKIQSRSYFSIGVYWFPYGKPMVNKLVWFRRHELKKMKADKKCPKKNKKIFDNT